MELRQHSAETEVEAGSGGNQIDEALLLACKESSEPHHKDPGSRGNAGGAMQPIGEHRGGRALIRDSVIIQQQNAAEKTHGAPSHQLCDNYLPLYAQPDFMGA